MPPSSPEPAPPLPFTVVGGTVRVRIRAAPGAGRNAILGLRPEADGGTALHVAVTAPADRGRANDALIALLAKEWHLPKSTLRLTRGAHDRHKSLEVAGELAVVLGRLNAWFCRLAVAGS